MVDVYSKGAAEQREAGPGEARPNAALPNAAAAPVSLIVVGTVISVVAAAALVIADFRPPASVIGWVLAGPVAVTLFVLYTVRDTRARREGHPASAPGVAWLYYLGLSVTCAAIIVNALSVGLWLGAL